MTHVLAERRDRDGVRWRVHHGSSKSGGSSTTSSGRLGAVGALLTSLWSAHSVAAVCVLAGLICGYAALKFGDAFWEHIPHTP